MSFDALTWAMRQDAGHPNAKLVLLALAQCASRADALAFPSLAELAKLTGLHRKTVMQWLGKLRADGLIEDSGKRFGHTGQVIGYHLPTDQPGLSLNAPKRGKQSPRGAALRTRKESQPGDALNGVEQAPSRNRSPAVTGNSGDANRPPAVTRNKSERTDTNVSVAAYRPNDVLNAWNEMASANHLPTAKTLTADRRKHLRNRVAEHGSQAIIAAIASIPQSPFLMGDNDRGWKANFDYLLRPGSMNRLIEGGYSQVSTKRGRNEPQTMTEIIAAELKAQARS